MSRKPTYFAIHMDDLERANGFYDGVVDWGFTSYGHNDYVQIKADKSVNSALIGVMQSRKYSPLPAKIIGLECNIGVENIDEMIDKVISKDGQVILPKTAIPYVGFIAKFVDTEDNLICEMQYHNAV
jgi:predicted enzyme related to lactoylglutathione lyase